MSFGDVRLANYLLEWGYQYLGGSALSDSIWSPPLFFPEPNVLAYSDTLFTAYPFYFAARSLGASPHASLLFFQVVQLWLTPLVGYACARWLGLGRLAAFTCAATFGWSWARYFQTEHVQFAMGSLVPLYFALCYRGICDRRAAWLGAALWTFVAAFFLSVYIACFLAVLTAIMSAAVALSRRRTLRRDLRALGSGLAAASRRGELAATCGAALVAIALLAWGADHYRAAARALGGADPQDAITYGASLRGWLRPAPGNLVWGGFADSIPPDATAPWEKHSYIGWAALLVCLLTPVLLSRRNASRWIRSRSGAPLVDRSTLVGAALVVPFVILFISDHPQHLDWLELPMRWVRGHVPGANAIRASGRICLVLSFLSSFVAATWVQLLAGAPRRLAALGSGALAALLVLENLAPTPPVADRCPDDRPWQEISAPICELARSRGAGTAVFLPAELTSLERIFSQVPAATLALGCGLRSVNGYVGHLPPRLQPIFAADPAVLPCDALAQALDAAQARLREPALIYVEEQGPLGAPQYGVGAVPECLRSCIADPTPAPIAGGTRSGVAWTTDPGRRCAADPRPASR